MTKLIITFLKFSLVLFLVQACREEIINPDTFIDSVNEPVQLNENSSYTYLVNANDFTSSLVIPSPINSYSARVNITLVDYSNGYANIIIKDNENRQRYNYYMDENINMFTDITDGYVPKIIEIKTYKFSGKLKIKLSRGSF